MNCSLTQTRWKIIGCWVGNGPEGDWKNLKID